jgi:hypothetical protein
MLGARIILITEEFSLMHDAWFLEIARDCQRAGGSVYATMNPHRPPEHAPPRPS